MNLSILLKKRPVGRPVLSDFEFTRDAITDPMTGFVLLKAVYVSVDPYLRGRMNDAKSYAPSFEIGKPIQSGMIARVVDSRHPEFKKEEYVSGNLEWKEYQISDGKGLTKVDPTVSPLSTYLGILGMTGMTAYLGLTEVGIPKAGETLVVSGAAGAVGAGAYC